MEKTTPYAHFRLEAGIVTCNYNSSVSPITDRILAEILQYKLHFQSGFEYPLLVRNVGHVEFTKTARAYLTEEWLSGASALAWMTLNPVDQTLAAFVYQREKLSIPLLVTNNECKALKWLGRFIDRSDIDCRLSHAVLE